MKKKLGKMQFLNEAELLNMDEMKMIVGGYGSYECVLRCDQTDDSVLIKMSDCRGTLNQWVDLCKNKGAVAHYPSCSGGANCHSNR